MTLEEYKKNVLEIQSSEDYKVFIQKYFFHGTPHIFIEREGEYYAFRKRVADKFKITYTDIYIVGSSRFGFSPYKFTDFTLDSDIDVVVFNEELFEHFFEILCIYQYQLKKRQIRLTQYQYKQYVKFIKYFVTGWMRPDLLPQNTNEFRELKAEWDDFFTEISHSKSEVGNYIVKGGLFKNLSYAERYYISSLEEVYQKLL